jgi:hypothetical protein
LATEGSEDNAKVASASVVVMSLDVERLLPRSAPERRGWMIDSVTVKSPTIFAVTFVLTESIVPTSVEDGSIPVRSRYFVASDVPNPKELVA